MFINCFYLLDKHKILHTTKNFFKSGQIYMKDAQWAETNKKSIFRFWRFSFFELWSILYSKSIEKWAISSNNEFFFSIFLSFTLLVVAVTDLAWWHFLCTLYSWFTGQVFVLEFLFYAVFRFSKVFFSTFLSFFLLGVARWNLLKYKVG